MSLLSLLVTLFFLLSAFRLHSLKEKRKRCDDIYVMIVNMRDPRFSVPKCEKENKVRLSSFARGK